MMKTIIRCIKRKIKKILPYRVIEFLKKILYWRRRYKGQIKCRKIKPFKPGKYPMGINLTGDIKAETGLGQSMRLLAYTLDKGEFKFMIKQMDAPGDLSHLEKTWDFKIEDKVKYCINLIHINTSIWMDAYNKFPNDMLNYRYNIAYWLWELEDFPDEWLPCIDTVDEIWTPSEFISRSIRKKTAKKVLTVPYSIELERSGLSGREYFSLPENKFLFLMMYDFMSVSERKNPSAVIKAYKKAFKDKNKDAGLIIKINHLSDKNELKTLKQELADFPNIYYITDNLTRKETESLIATADVLVSLHRAEGFGLPLAEAMYLGTPVISTNWSSTTEFMNEDCACLVDYTLVKLEENIGPYKKGNHWADADIEQASEYMQKLFTDKEFYGKMKINAQKYIEQNLNNNKCAEIIKKRIKEINSGKF